jgi:hypothetical protein
MKVTKAKGQNTSIRFVCQEGSADHDRRRSTTEPFGQMNSPNRVRAFCFGDFHLGQQMKVTRLPGGTGAGQQTTENVAEATTKTC